MNLEPLYLCIPIWMQNAACSAKGWQIQRSRYGSDFWRLLREYEDRGAWARHELEQWRDARLRSFLKHCYETVPFYRRSWDEIGFDSRAVCTLDDLRALPILDKQTLKDNYEQLLSTSVRRRDRIIAHTSGSSGSGLRFAVTRQFELEQWAVWWRYRRWHGIQTDTWCAYFGGRSLVPLAQTVAPFWRVNRPGRQVMFSAYHLTPANLTLYIHELNRLRLPWIHGYPSVISLLASHLIKQRKQLDYAVKWVSTGAENLLQQQQDLIRQAFGVSPIQHYGMSEGVANISQRPDGHLHVDEDFSAVEFIPHESGSLRIVGTNFANLALPMVRYEVGDTAQLPESPAEQLDRIGGRRVISVDGRLEDYVILKNGAPLGRLDHIFKDLTEIHEAQIYQPRRGAIVVRVVKGTGYTPKTEARLLDEFRQRVGDLAELTVEYHDKLARTNAGKLRFVVSDVD